MTTRIIVIRVADMKLETPAFPRPEYKTTDFRRKLLVVHFDNGTCWTPTLKDRERMIKGMQEAYWHNLQFPDPDKEDPKKDSK